VHPGFSGVRVLTETVFRKKYTVFLHVNMYPHSYVNCTYIYMLTATENISLLNEHNSNACINTSIILNWYTVLLCTRYSPAFLLQFFGGSETSVML